MPMLGVLIGLASTFNFQVCFKTDGTDIHLFIFGLFVCGLILSKFVSGELPKYVIFFSKIIRLHGF